MRFTSDGTGGLDYDLYQIEGSRSSFRGPMPDLSGEYIACLGGIDTFGRFIERPFPTLLAGQLQRPVVNLGAVNAGLDLYLNDPAVLEVAHGAALRVIQVMGAQNMSNRFYQVHPRRNDRFLCASQRLSGLYPEVDFTEFHFNRHMLSRLAEISAERYLVVVEELQAAWVARMRTLTTILGGPSVLLWFANHPPPESGPTEISDQALYVTRPMLQAVQSRMSEVIEVTVQQESVEGMHFAQHEQQAAENTLGPKAHFEASTALMSCLRPMLSRDAA